MLAFEGIARVQEAGLRGMITVRGDLSSAKMKKAAKDALGAALPGQREVTFAAGAAVAWMSPDELLAMVPYEDAESTVAAFDKALKGEHYLAVNVSDARAVFRVSGAGAREVIAKLSPVDLSPAAFAPGQISADPHGAGAGRVLD